jgi:hypothetical protein
MSQTETLAVFTASETHFAPTRPAAFSPGGLPVLYEVGEVIRLAPGEWPGPDWVPQNSAARAALAAARLYTNVLNDCRSPLGVPFDDPRAGLMRQSIERAATACARLARSHCYRELLQLLPQDASTKHAISKLKVKTIDFATLGEAGPAVEKAAAAAIDVVRKGGDVPFGSADLDDEAEESDVIDEDEAEDPSTARPQPRPEMAAAPVVTRARDRQRAAAKRPSDEDI